MVDLTVFSNKLAEKDKVVLMEPHEYLEMWVELQEEELGEDTDLFREKITRLIGNIEAAKIGVIQNHLLAVIGGIDE